MAEGPFEPLHAVGLTVLAGAINRTPLAAGLRSSLDDIHKLLLGADVVVEVRFADGLGGRLFGPGFGTLPAVFLAVRLKTGLLPGLVGLFLGGRQFGRRGCGRAVAADFGPVGDREGRSVGQRELDALRLEATATVGEGHAGNRQSGGDEGGQDKNSHFLKHDNPFLKVLIGKNCRFFYNSTSCLHYSTDYSFCQDYLATCGKILICSVFLWMFGLVRVL